MKVKSTYFKDLYRSLFHGIATDVELELLDGNSYEDINFQTSSDDFTDTGIDFLSFMIGNSQVV